MASFVAVRTAFKACLQGVRLISSVFRPARYTHSKLVETEPLLNAFVNGGILEFGTGQDLIKLADDIRIFEIGC